jgi:flagellar hook-associated protein 1
MPNISSLYTSLSALQTQRKVMDVTAHNVANEATPGYHRQRVELQSLGARPIAGVMAGAQNRPYGVTSTGVTRSVDVLLEARMVREEGNRSAANKTSSTMATIEGIFPEPSDTGLSSQLAEFWGAWSDVATNPESLSSRTALLQKATTLTENLHRASTDLTAVRNNAIERTGSLAIEVNDIAGRVADLNTMIVANPGDDNDLIDQRDMLVTSLSKLTGAVAQPSPGGMVDVYVNGRSIVSGTIAHEITGAGGTLRFTADNLALNPVSGEAGALAATITDIVPRYTAALDDVASTIVTQVNALHTTGYDQNSVTGRNFFDPANTTAASISLSADVLGQPANIAAGAPAPGPPGALDGEQARLLAALAESSTGPDSKYHALISGLAVETQATSRRADIQNQVADAAQSEADSVGAVSLDEEMANLTSAQRAFEAASRVLTAVDDMLAFLIERTGVVGR